MEISLVRHGRSQLTENDKITCLDFKKWVEKYNYNGVFEELTYPSFTTEKVVNAKIVITSDLKRAVQSAKLLNPGVKIIPNPLFRETELPVLSLKLLDIKLRPSSWAIILRFQWFCGYSYDCESLSDAKLRANKASQQLISYAKEFNSVALIGHGFFNMLIARELQKKGWKGKRKSGVKHWDCTTYSLFN
ncbi:histidine phosphatase family protein [Bacillus sp. JJ1566]|uniref:histidine phosphatase family protein n=1 Tax=Bacillus sp. JJ1566 TaxID=3122961 RepID=UPI002FFE1BD8